MKTLVQKLLVATAGISALFSGLLWHLSAKAALSAFAITQTTTTAQKALHDLQFLSMQENLWAAYAAAISGIALATTLALDA